MTRRFLISISLSAAAQERGEAGWTIRGAQKRRRESWRDTGEDDFARDCLSGRTGIVRGFCPDVQSAATIRPAPSFEGRSPAAISSWKRPRAAARSAGPSRTSRRGSALRNIVRKAGTVARPRSLVGYKCLRRLRFFRSRGPGRRDTAVMRCCHYEHAVVIFATDARLLGYCSLRGPNSSSLHA